MVGKVKDRWRRIPGFPHFQVSSSGVVRRILPHNGDVIRRLPLTLKQWDNQAGYKLVQLKDAGGNPKTQLVHRLVLLAFRGQPKDERFQCCHGNGVRSDNRLDNLRWGSSKDNHDDCLRHGHRPMGEKVGKSKLTEEQVREIRSTWTGRLREQATLAAKFGVARATINKIVNRQTWNHI